MVGCRGEALGREITLDPAELDHARWLTREETAEVLSGRHAEVLPARPGAIARFLLEAWLSDRLG
jgi:NAD+ diphosphatase